MSEHSIERLVTVVGIDLAKRSFHVYGADGQGASVFSKKLTRAGGPLHSQPATLHGRDGGVRQCTPLGADLSGLRS